MTITAFYLLSLLMSSSLAFTLVLRRRARPPRRRYAAVRLRRAHRRRPRTAALAGWYVIVYLIGLGVIGFLDHVPDLDHLGITIGTVLVTSPLSFIGARLLVRQPASGSTPSG